MVSVIFSNDIGFCLNMTFPFFISTSLCFVCGPAGKLLVLLVPTIKDGRYSLVYIGGSRLGALSVSGHKFDAISEHRPTHLYEKVVQSSPIETRIAGRDKQWGAEAR
jgi:hypothetical protein